MGGQDGKKNGTFYPSLQVRPGNEGNGEMFFCFVLPTTSKNQNQDLLSQQQASRNNMWMLFFSLEPCQPVPVPSGKERAIGARTNGGRMGSVICYAKSEASNMPSGSNWNSCLETPWNSIVLDLFKVFFTLDHAKLPSKHHLEQNVWNFFQASNEKNPSYLEISFIVFLYNETKWPMNINPLIFQIFWLFHRDLLSLYIMIISVVVSKIFYFHPYLGKPTYGPLVVATNLSGPFRWISRSWVALVSIPWTCGAKPCWRYPSRRRLEGFFQLEKVGSWKGVKGHEGENQVI